MATRNDINENDFWSLVRRLAGRVPFMVDAVAMWYAMWDDATPWWASCAIAVALAYFISPWDAYPDMLPGGWVDDAGVIAAALATVRVYVTEAHYDRARETLGIRE